MSMLQQRLLAHCVALSANLSKGSGESVQSHQNLYCSLTSVNFSHMLTTKAHAASVIAMSDQGQVPVCPFKERWLLYRRYCYSNGSFASSEALSVDLNLF